MGKRMGIRRVRLCKENISLYLCIVFSFSKMSFVMSDKEYLRETEKKE